MSTGAPIVIPVTIASGQSLSAVIDLQGGVPLGVIMPASWDAANLTFQAAGREDGTFQNVYNDVGSEVTVTAAAGRFIVMDPTTAPALRYIKVRSGTSGTPVNQIAARILLLVVKYL